MYEAGEGRTKIQIKSLWFLLVYASDLVEALKSKDHEQLRAGAFDADLLDSLARILISDAERRLRESLAAGPRRRSATLTRVRGRVDHLTTARNRLLESGTVYCNFVESTFDRPRYQYLLATLQRISGHLESEILRSKCIALSAQLERAGVSRRDPTLSELSREQYGFNNASDRGLIRLCQLLRQLAIPEHSVGQTNLPVITRDERMLRMLFEKAVRNYYRFHLQPMGWSVTPSIINWFAFGELEDLSHLPRHETDALLKSPDGRTLIVECKFAPIFYDSHGQAKLKQDYLRQLFSYCASAHASSDSTIEPEGILLAVRTEDGLGRNLDFRLGAYPIRVRLIDLTGDTRAIRDALDEAVWGISVGNES